MSRTGEDKVSQGSIYLFFCPYLCVVACGFAGRGVSLTRFSQRAHSLFANQKTLLDSYDPIICLADN